MQYTLLELEGLWRSTRIQTGNGKGHKVPSARRYGFEDSRILSIVQTVTM